MQRIRLAVLLIGIALAGAPALAQNTGASGGGYGGFGTVGGGPDYGGPPARRRLAVPPDQGAMPGPVCVTPRLSCAAPHAPRGTRCACELPSGRIQRGRVR